MDPVDEPRYQRGLGSVWLEQHVALDREQIGWTSEINGSISVVLVGIELLLNSSHLGNSGRLGDSILGGDKDSKRRLRRLNPCLTKVKSIARGN